MEEERPSRAELLYRLRKFKRYAVWVSLAVMVPGAHVLVFLVAVSLDAPWWVEWLIYAGAVALVVSLVAIVTRKSRYDRFGLLCPHCGEMAFGRTVYPSDRQVESVLASGRCTVCGEQITSD